MRAPVVHHPAYTAPLPQAHRFPMAKFAALFMHLQDAGLARDVQVVTPEPAPRPWLELAHDPAWVTAVLDQRIELAAERRLGLPMSPSLALRSRCAVAGTALAARLALEHGVACNTAGGSHHAHPGFGSGFCVFNDVAVAAKLLLAEGTVDQILVVDLDVHQGDGTAAAARDDPRITTFSMHCRTNFPARKEQSDLDVALDPGVGDRLYLETLEAALPPLLDRSRPDLVFYNAGVDPHEDDQLGRLAMTDAGLMERERYVLDTCRRRGLPLVGVMGGGYAPDLASLVRRHAILHEAIAGLPDW